MTHIFNIFSFQTKIKVAGFVFLIFFMTGCVSIQPRWEVRTTSTLFSSPSDLVSLEQEAVALLTPLAPTPLLRGDEAGLGLYLAESIKKIAPAWKIMDEQQTIALINRYGLTEEYTRLRQGIDQSHILDRKLLQKIGKSLGARYVFQPRLAYISQTMTDRFEAPVTPFLILQTRSAVMRLSLQLWDTMSGEPVWSSAAESVVLGETASLEPMFIKDAARVAFGGMLTDLLTRKTSSKYTRLNRFLDRLIQEKDE
ncbi:hypothetical protein [Nitrosomonas sp. Is37]|uniref:hypothetical protein n=1 Tax=Nitrosomonas sp. Is37 TaxID=3080535 RepID=UPI00294AA184|nr:hypothetical protein [Nitrosomonas sp. Is37]MDV6343923.1 hypothetical protein [Nitrosomonas sp. Is37]